MVSVAKSSAQGKGKELAGVQQAISEKKPSEGHATPGDKERSVEEKEKCYIQDNERCIVTGVANPHVCHIIPFAWNNTATRCDEASTLSILLDYFVTPGHCLYQLCREVGSSDKVWNMVALSPLLHSWWSKGYFALKYLGSDPAEATSSLAVITLQFRWMPRSSVQNGIHIVKLEDQRDPRKGLLAQLNHHYGDGVSTACDTEGCTGCYRTSLVGVANLESNHRICSGDIIKVRREAKYVPEFKSMIDLQWALICTAAMSGAAGTPELLRGLDDDQDEPSADKRVEEWRKDVVPGQEAESDESH